MEPVLNIYLKELKNENSTKEESIELVKLSRAGDTCAREKLIKNYLLLVVKIAREYMNMGVPLGDLINEGNLGLITATEKYDSEKGPFSTYSKYWIRQAIIRNCMHKKRIVRLPENISELMRTDRWKGLEYREISIDTPTDEGNTMADDIPDTSSVDPFHREDCAIMKNRVERILSFLHSRDADIVKACYGIDRDKPIDIIDAAELFNLSTTRINQILRSSLKKMRVSHNSLPETSIVNVEIVSAHYGNGNDNIDVTDRVTNLYLNNENIKSCNRLGGDPCPGIIKTLTIKYISNSQLLEKSFSEGSVIKF